MVLKTIATNADKLNSAFETNDFSIIIDVLIEIYEAEFGGPIRMSKDGFGESTESAHRRAGKVEAIRDIKERHEMFKLIKERQLNVPTT